MDEMEEETGMNRSDELKLHSTLATGHEARVSLAAHVYNKT